MALKHLVDLNLGGNEIQNVVLQNLATAPTGVAGQIFYDTAISAVKVHTGSGFVRIGATADGSTITESSGVFSVGTIAQSKVTNLVSGLAGKVDDSQVLTNVPVNAVFTDTTYSVADGQLSEINFTGAFNDKLNAIEAGATATAHPAITTNGSSPALSSGISQAEVRTLIGAGTSSFNGAYASLTGVPTSFAPSAHNHAIGEVDSLQEALDLKLEAGALTGYATETYVTTAVSNVIALAPAALDTLNELAASINDDANFAGTMTTALGNKLNSSAYTAADVLTKIKTVDGAGSGLDADKLDGQSSAYYRNYNNLTNTPTIPTFVSVAVTGAGANTDLSIGLGGFANIQIYEAGNLVMTEIYQDGAGTATATLTLGVDYNVVAIGA